MALASPFFRSLPLDEHGLEWIAPPSEVAHPFDQGDAAILSRDLDETASRLGVDAQGYRTLVGGAVRAWDNLEEAILGPPRLPRHPLALARFGIPALQPAASMAHRYFVTPRAAGLLAGIAAHTMVPLDTFPSGAVGVVLAATGHRFGWQFPRRGAQSLADALARHLSSLGGRLFVNTPIASLDELPRARAILCDLSPGPFLRIAGRALPDRYRDALHHYRYGMGVFKVDWALDGPIPWRDPLVRTAATVHLGGTLEEIAASEQAAWNGRTAERPYVLLAQHTLFDPSRAPAGHHTVWAYCHVPHASAVDMLPRIEAQIERFAPGFRDRVLARRATTPADLEARNPNLVGGDIGMGVTDLRQMIARPTWREYATPVRGLYLCSAATPPGVGVHGMCGYHAATLALARELR